MLKTLMDPVPPTGVRLMICIYAQKMFNLFHHVTVCLKQSLVDESVAVRILHLVK